MNISNIKVRRSEISSALGFSKKLPKNPIASAQENVDLDIGFKCGGYNKFYDYKDHAIVFVYKSLCYNLSGQNRGISIICDEIFNSKENKKNHWLSNSSFLETDIPFNLNIYRTYFDYKTYVEIDSFEYSNYFSFNNPKTSEIDRYRSSVKGKHSCSISINFDVFKKQMIKSYSV